MFPSLVKPKKTKTFFTFLGENICCENFSRWIQSSFLAPSLTHCLSFHLLSSLKKRETNSHKKGREYILLKLRQVNSIQFPSEPSLTYCLSFKFSSISCHAYKRNNFFSFQELVLRRRNTSKKSYDKISNKKSKSDLKIKMLLRF